MNSCYPFINTPLPYAFDALEPFIDEKTMCLHHDRHLQTYIDNLNALLKDHPDFQNWSLEQLAAKWCCLPPHLQIPVRNNAGGVFNHRFFFDSLTVPNSSRVSDRLFYTLSRQFCSFEQFLTTFKEAALSVFGSGYAWLILEQRQLKIVTTANQETPLEKGQIPLLNLDVWEHAYYLKHYNVRAAYVDDWLHVINWDMVQKRLQD